MMMIRLVLFGISNYNYTSSLSLLFLGNVTRKSCSSSIAAKKIFYSKISSSNTLPITWTRKQTHLVLCNSCRWISTNRHENSGRDDDVDDDDDGNNDDASTSYKKQNRRNTNFPHPPNIRSDNPFRILGISNSATYDEVKRRFFELALQHHPDIQNKSKEGNKNKNTNSGNNNNSIDEFIKIRQAFEAIKEDKDGMATTRTDDDTASSYWSSDEEFNAWFYEETGHADIMFRMDIQTRKEVIDVVNNNQSQGGLDRGGLWEMARKMAQQEEILKDQKGKYQKSTIGIEMESNTSTPGSSGGRRRRRR